MITFVGAGCGAPDLITLRGQRLLEQADVIVYAGSLVNPELLNGAKEGCALFNSAEMTLDEVIGVMETAAKEGREVVRLHSGDPCLYGAIREQMDRLDELGLPYEVCPGVSSFCGAAASLKAEYTLPGVSQTVILTRMAGRTGVPEREKISALAAHRATMVIFLSASRTSELQEELLSGGYPETTPCAVVYKATWPEERVFRGQLRELSGLAEKNNIRKTALIVVGEFLGSDHELSRLYDKSFSTEFREASV